MKAIFNKGTDSELSLNFTQIVEAFSENLSSTLSLELKKTDLENSTTMIDYCAPIFALNSIQTIHCYNDDNSEEGTEIMIFNKYNTIFNCRTTVENSTSIVNDTPIKTGLLTLIQKR